MAPVEKLLALVTRRRGRMSGRALKDVLPGQVYQSIKHGFGDEP